MQLVGKQAVKIKALKLVVTTCVAFSGLVPPSDYSINRLHRKNYKSKPYLFGSIVRTGRVSHPFGIKYVIINANNLTTYPDTAGRYQREFEQGVYNITIAQLGYRPIRLKGFKMHCGDSIRLDARLRGDTALID